MGLGNRFVTPVDHRQQTRLKIDHQKHTFFALQAHVITSLLSLW